MYTIDMAPKDLTPPFGNTISVMWQAHVFIPKMIGDTDDCKFCSGRRFINPEEKPNSCIPCPECNKTGSISVLSVPVWAWKSLWDGEIYLSGTTIDYLDTIKKLEMEKIDEA
ncbi:MAG: hypothetical protein M0P12_03055 [Paludibacteraceae bacterium]|nr:hypothetical protein [Paludibacteraceae bacterium]